MKTVKKIMIVFALLLLSIFSIYGVSASENASSVTVSYTSDKSYAYVKLQVDVEGNGEVLDMNQPIRNGSVIYDLLEGDAKTFTISPDQGYRIYRIEYFNGYTTVDLSSQLKDSSITILVEDQDALLTVTFKKEQSELVPDKEPSETGSESQGTPKDTQHIVQTGDMTSKESILMLMGISLSLMMLVWKRKKDKISEGEA